jgi:hypothetical protein
MFGIRCCDQHRQNAKRDCLAYLHTEKMVLTKDVIKHEVCGKLLNILNNLEDGFPVLRTNSEIQKGWKIDCETILDRTFIERNDEGWHIPVILKNGVDTIYKHTNVYNFTKLEIFEQIKDKVPSNFNDIINEFITFLDQGIYKEYYDQFVECSKNGINTVSEIPEVNLGYLNGNIVRYIVCNKDQSQPEKPKENQINIVI